jgi:hypothetical protein
MISRQSFGLLFPLLCVCTIAPLGNHSSAEELFSVHLREVTEGEFPSHHWFPADRLSIESEMDSMKTLVNELATLDQSAMKKIKRSFADRAVVVRDLDAANLRDRINEVCDAHQLIIEKVQNTRWSNATHDVIPFEIEEQRYQIQSLAYLVNLYAAHELSEGRIESASKTLAGGFAFAHNLIHTYGDLNVLTGIVMQSVLTQGIADMQSMGAPDMRLVLGRLVESQVDQEMIDRSLWKNICRTMPVLIDRPRNGSEWHPKSRAVS